MAQARTASSGTVTPSRIFSPGQRAFALFWGALCHGTFLVAISAMAVGLFTGMRLGRGMLEGGVATFANFLLIIQFAVLHSILLSAKGRRWMARIPLFGIGSELSTTTFALLSSLQILAVFLLWSPSESVWFAPSGSLLIVWTAVFASAWLLLMKSMSDSGLELQTGSLGWRAVWQNRPLEFPGYAMRGLYRLSRQPIYVAFALILWTAPIWTPDHFFIACLWTLYCLLGPIFKERRFLKFYGDGYRNYATTVPFWLPFPTRHRRSMNALPSEKAPADFDVIIAGAGPVGMVLANLLGKDDHRVLVVEPRMERSKQSRAIGITAPTLKTLNRIGILDDCLAEAVKIGDAKVFGDDQQLLGHLSFPRSAGGPAEVISLPQRRLEQLLEESLESLPTVSVWKGRRVASHQNESSRVCAEIIGENDLPQQVSARWMVACDGAKSLLREQLRMPTRRKEYGCAFAMADFADHSDFGDDVRLFFTASGAVETFPLPNGQRRWVVQLADRNSTGLEDESLLATIKARAHFSPDPSERKTPWSPFVPQRLLCDRFFHGRTILCGDSAHVMSPIGGHGMNVGVGDAIAAHTCLTKLLSIETADSLRCLRSYHRTRQNAFVRSSRRAALGMWMGTRTGRRLSAARAVVLRLLLSASPLRNRIARHFAMVAELNKQIETSLVPATATDPATSPTT
jgi:2-polyprenyl-6-methoxyphenol hydroxylase-like FAD-dependent oxidoreductase/protein-S-isoprenylcysteine O-methyltransferase Ste14